MFDILTFCFFFAGISVNLVIIIPHTQLNYDYLHKRCNVGETLAFSIYGPFQK